MSSRRLYQHFKRLHCFHIQGQEGKRRKKPVWRASSRFLAWLTLQPARWEEVPSSAVLVDICQVTLYYIPEDSYYHDYLKSCILMAVSILCEVVSASHNRTNLNPSWEAASCAATQELPSILWNPNIHNHLHEIPPQVPILPDQLSSHHPIQSLKDLHLGCPILPDQSRSHHPILSLKDLHLGCPSGLFPCGFPTNIPYAFLFSPVMLALPISSSLTWGF
jgi:hypothetical protein